MYICTLIYFSDVQQQKDNPTRVLIILWLSSFEEVFFMTMMGFNIHCFFVFKIITLFKRNFNVSKTKFIRIRFLSLRGLLYLVNNIGLDINWMLHHTLKAQSHRRFIIYFDLVKNISKNRQQHLTKVQGQFPFPLPSPLLSSNVSGSI